LRVVEEAAKMAIAENKIWKKMNLTWGTLSKMQ
jgi:hypothetical protein